MKFRRNKKTQAPESEYIVYDKEKTNEAIRAAYSAVRCVLADDDEALAMEVNATGDYASVTIVTLARLAAGLMSAGMEQPDLALEKAIAATYR